MEKRTTRITFGILAVVLLGLLIWIFSLIGNIHSAYEESKGFRYNGNRYTTDGCYSYFSEDRFFRVYRKDEVQVGRTGWIRLYRQPILVSGLDPEANIAYTEEFIMVKEGFEFPDPYTTPIVGFSIYGFMQSPTEKDPNATAWYIFYEADTSQHPFTLEEILTDEKVTLALENRKDRLYMFVEGHPYLIMDLRICIMDGCVYIQLPQDAGYEFRKIKAEYQSLFMYERHNDCPGDDGIQPFHFGWYDPE